MKKLVIAFILGNLLVLLALFFIGFTKSKKAGLIVDTDPVSTVFVNGKEVGKTKFEGTLDAGEIVLRLVPNPVDKPMPFYETRINLVRGIKTVVQRTFGDSSESSSGVVISFEKTGGDLASVSVISLPDAASLVIDDDIKGTTPFGTSGLSEGSHKISLFLKDFREESYQIKTKKGYKMTIAVSLAKEVEKVLGETYSSPTPALPEEKKLYVEVLDTPTGFLRVRAEPSTLGKEVGEALPGRNYLLVKVDTKTGWFKIEYLPSESEGQEGKFGWISNKYARKVDESLD